ncbi:hypothetical protein F4556_006885 [Kitasatospora gansuensis]|uniref:Uncharacterized protein n=1 Tax=Kitasatospora gansuensis TaxID=258050 RepID=A0A7W7SJ17_9ACTN|nr:hypothetical protein [Kitasatospora gansuensis]
MVWTIAPDGLGATRLRRADGQAGQRQRRRPALCPGPAHRQSGGAAGKPVAPGRDRTAPLALTTLSARHERGENARQHPDRKLRPRTATTGLTTRDLSQRGLLSLGLDPGWTGLADRLLGVLAAPPAGLADPAPLGTEPPVATSGELRALLRALAADHARDHAWTAAREARGLWVGDGGGWASASQAGFGGRGLHPRQRPEPARTGHRPGPARCGGLPRVAAAGATGGGDPRLAPAGGSGRRTSPGRPAASGRAPLAAVGVVSAARVASPVTYPLDVVLPSVTSALPRRLSPGRRSPTSG